VAFRKEHSRTLFQQSASGNAPHNQSAAWIGGVGNGAGPSVTQHHSPSQPNELAGPSLGLGNRGPANSSNLRSDFPNQNQHLGLQHSVSQPHEYQAGLGLAGPGLSPPRSDQNVNANGIKASHAQMSFTPGYPHPPTPLYAHGNPYLSNAVRVPSPSSSNPPHHGLHSNGQTGQHQAAPAYNGTGASPISQSNSLMNDQSRAMRYSPRTNHHTGHNSVEGMPRDEKLVCAQLPSQDANDGTKRGAVLDPISREPSRSPASVGLCYTQPPNSSQRGKRKRIDHASPTPRYDSDIRSSPEPVQQRGNLESTPGLSEGQHMDGQGGRVPVGESFQINHTQQLPHAHMQGAEVNHKVRENEQKTQDVETEVRKFRMAEGLSSGDNSFQQKTLAFRTPSQSKIARSTDQSPQLTVRGIEGTPEDLTHVMSPKGGTQENTTDKSQRELQEQSPVREHNTSRSRQEDQHNSNENRKVQQFSEIVHNDFQNDSRHTSQEQQSAEQNINATVTLQSELAATRNTAKLVSQANTEGAQIRQDQSDQGPHAHLDTEHSSQEGSLEGAGPSTYNGQQNSAPMTSTSIMNEVGIQGVSSRTDQRKVTNAAPGANAVAVAASSLPAGTFIVHMTSSGFVYMHENVYRIWPGGQVIQMPSTPRSAVGTNPQISSVARRRRPPPFQNSTKYTDASDVAENPTVQYASGNKEHRQNFRPLLENTPNADTSGRLGVPANGPRCSLSDSSIPMRTAVTRGTGTDRSPGSSQKTPVFKQNIDGAHDRGSKSGQNIPSSALDVTEKDIMPVDKSDAKTDAWTNSRDRAHGPNDDDDGSVKSSRQGSAEPSRPGSGTPSQRSNASGASVGRRGRGSGGGGKISRGRGRGRGRDPPPRNPAARVREGNRPSNKGGRGKDGRPTSGGFGDSGDGQGDQERGDAQQVDFLSPAVRSPSLVDMNLGMEQNAIGQTIPAASNGAVYRDTVFQFGTSNISSAPADVLRSHVECGTEDRLEGAGHAEQRRENNCLVDEVEHGDEVNPYAKVSGNQAAAPLVRDEHRPSKLTSAAVGFGYADEFQRYLNCGPDEENVLGNILDMNNNLNRMNGGLSLGTDGYEDDDAGILGGGDPDDNFDLGTGQDS
jgi:hypothetical protein